MESKEKYSHIKGWGADLPAPVKLNLFTSLLLQCRNVTSTIGVLKMDEKKELEQIPFLAQIIAQNSILNLLVNQ